MEQNNEKKVFVSIEEYDGEKPIEVLYREGDDAKEQLPLVNAKMPKALNIEGTIGSVYEWLGKHIGDVEISHCRIEVDREAGRITLIINDADCNSEYNPNNFDGFYMYDMLPRSTVTGTISMTKEFAGMHINDGVWWQPAKLAKFFRLNRHLFADPEDAMATVSQLKNVKAKITGDYEKQQELHGKISKTEFFQQNVEHNLPGSIRLKLQIFKGGVKEIYDVELDADIIEGDIMVQLVSPLVNEKYDSACGVLIDAELDNITELAPNLVIIEK